VTEAVTDLARSWWEWCAAISVQLGVLTVCVAALDRVLRRRVRPQALLALWLLLAVKVVVPPTMGSPWSLFVLWAPLALDAAAPLRSDPPALPLFLVWLFGCGFSGAVFAWRCRGLRREWLGSGTQPIPPRAALLARGAAERLGLERLPRVCIARGAPGPAVVGFLRPVVVLPAGLVESATPEEVTHVLLHELAHVKRRDPALQLLSIVLQAALWYHPSIWLARRRLSVLAELCCDDEVATALRGGTAEYRRTLLRLARPMFAHGSSGALGFFRRRSHLLLRMEWLERRDAWAPGRGGRWRARALAGGLCALVFCFCVPLARPRGGIEDLSLPPLESLQGCLQVRYAVQAALARRSLDRESTRVPDV
jgi:beta-lactamase regulating signal transducer with metallopeptidase domain